MTRYCRAARCCIVLLAVLVSGAGCIDMTHDLRLSKDGAAVYRLQYSITESAIAQFRALDVLSRDLAYAEDRRGEGGIALHPLLAALLDPRDGTIAAALARYEDAGLVVEELRVSSREAQRRVDLRVAVRDLKLLESTGFFQDHGFALESGSDGNYTFRRHPHIEESLWPVHEVDEEDRRQLSLLLNGFRCVVRVTVPGRIISSTARSTSLQTASWEFDFSTMPDVLLRLQKQAFRIAFEGRDVRLPQLDYTGPAARRP